MTVPPRRDDFLAIKNRRPGNRPNGLLRPRALRSIAHKQKEAKQHRPNRTDRSACVRLLMLGGHVVRM